MTSWTLRWLVIGVVLDITATGFMIAGSSSGLFTLHGFLGFSALAGMLVETVSARRHRERHGDDPVPRWLHRYSRLAFGWWIVAYVTGAYLVMGQG